ncbi:DUF1775 domain-containing protein [Streptomyces sp. NPDC051907]|uniref:DUF1775 domain-containing protein n=1 Tax=Streptomyces sp. NPDC051907 TaxID=3155284 RepID=UPI0034453C48
MSRSTWARVARRSPIALVGAFVASVALAAPASAHVEVDADGARALAQNVEVSFSAESESASAGITKLEVILPSGLNPADIGYKDGPKGWKLAPTDRGYTVAGPAVAAGEDVSYSVIVRQLPDAESVAFKTLQSYSDGRVDRWIELEKSHDDGGGHGHGNSAPVLELKPAAAGAKPVPPSASATTPEPATPAPTTQKPTAAASGAQDSDAAGKETASDDSSSMPLIILSGAVVLVGAVAGVWWWRRKSSADAS